MARSSARRRRRPPTVPPPLAGGGASGAEFVREARAEAGRVLGRPVTQEAFARMLEPRVTLSLIEKVERGRANVSPRLTLAVHRLLSRLHAPPQSDAGPPDNKERRWQDPA